MKLVEADAEGPSGEEPIVTPPRPEKRRVSISLVFTLSVLIATVVTIYVVFPARNNELLTAALAEHATAPRWDLTSPSDAELRAWMLGTVGRDAPLPAGLTPSGAAQIHVLRRATAVLRYPHPDGDFTYLVQHIRSASPRSAARRVEGLRAVQWREGDWLIVSVGKDGGGGESWLGAARQRAGR